MAAMSTLVRDEDRSRRESFHVHLTLSYGSWLNLVERWISELTTKWLRRGTHHSLSDLKAITQWTATWNENPKPFD